MPDVTACPSCGISFKAFRSGDSFSGVSKELYPGLPKSDWLKPYTRKTVLGVLKERKATAWLKHLEECREFMKPQDLPGSLHQQDEAPKPVGWTCDRCHRTADVAPHTMSLAFCDDCMDDRQTRHCNAKNQAQPAIRCMLSPGHSGDHWCTGLGWPREESP